jgi:tRNA-specific adenosine deaminase 3
LKQAGHDTPDLGHLKRIRKQNDLMTFLICNAATSTGADTIEPPSLPSISDPNQTTNQDLALPAPYIVSVPASSALTSTSLAFKSEIWPTIYTPRRKDEFEPWTRGKLRWAWDAMKWTVDAAVKAAEEHEVHFFLLPCVAEKLTVILSFPLQHIFQFRMTLFYRI